MPASCPAPRDGAWAAAGEGGEAAGAGVGRGPGTLGSRGVRCPYPQAQRGVGGVRSLRGKVTCCPERRPSPPPWPHGCAGSKLSKRKACSKVACRRQSLWLCMSLRQTRLHFLCHSFRVKMRRNQLLFHGGSFGNSAWANKLFWRSLFCSPSSRLFHDNLRKALIKDLKSHFVLILLKRHDLYNSYFQILNTLHPRNKLRSKFQPAFHKSVCESDETQAQQSLSLSQLSGSVYVQMALSVPDIVRKRKKRTFIYNYIIFYICITSCI